MRTFAKVIAAAALVTTALLAPAQAASTIRVTLNDKAEGMDMSKSLGLGLGMKGDMSKAVMSIDVSTKQVIRGKVTFNVTNGSKTMIHELIVAPVKDENQLMPYDDAAFKVKEEDSTHLGEVSELDPGKTGSLILDLKPGKYLLYCNVAGHYMDGMWTLIDVK
jgi:uncharacterized cupredoxin-like copper-binding protein